MTCSDNEKRLKSKSSKQKYITGAEQTRTSKKLEVGSGSMEE